VGIADIRIAPDETVKVTIQVSDVVSDSQHDTQHRHLRSGVYDLRLFRDGQMVANWPNDGAEKLLARPAKDLKVDAHLSDDQKLSKSEHDWRQATKLDLGANGRKTFTAHVRLPRGKDISQMEFTAYAFNEDRVKSETAHWTWPEAMKAQLPKAQPVKRRAYLISVGVNTLEGWKLNYAAADARLMNGVLAEQLKSTGYEVVPVLLVADDEMREGKTVAVRDATKAKVQAVLDLLAGKPVDEQLRRSLPNYEQLQQATPDDLVLLSFSSHGYANREGVFYLFPYIEGQNATNGEQQLPDLQSCISSDELSLWLRDVDAGEMEMIVDACHAAAAVKSGDFKPGPMGSRGLGQLSYDKGMRILTATQAVEDLAAEAAVIKQGLLSYALVEEGIRQRRAARNGEITMRSWLQYGVTEVPELYKRIANHDPTLVPRAGGRVDQDKKTESYQQQPSLFDFARKRPDVTLMKVSASR
jgi:hypothetical protein